MRRRLFGTATGTIAVHVLVKGKIGEGWYDVDQHIVVPVGATLGVFLDEADRQGLRVRAAIAASPHLEHTLMLNGERCPVEANLSRPMADGDEVYLLSPLAGG